MRLTTTLAAAAVLAVSGVTANAGGLSTPVMTTAPMVEVMTPAPAGSLNSGYIVLGLLVALVAAAGSF